MDGTVYLCHSLMDGIERFLRVLEKGEWRQIGDIASRLGWTRSKTIRLAEFLSEHGLVHYRRSEDSVMLDPELSALMRET